MDNGENLGAPVAQKHPFFELRPKGRARALGGVGYLILQLAIIQEQGPESKLREALGRDTKGPASALLYAAGIGVAFIQPMAAVGLYVLVALMWLVPDPRIEKNLAK